MFDVIQAGDVLIRRAGDGLIDVIDAVTRRKLGCFSSYADAFTFATTQNGAVWQQNERDEVKGPVLLVSNSRAPSL